MNALDEWISRRAEELGVSRTTVIEDLAERCKVGPSTVRNAARGAVISAEKAIPIARECGIPWQPLTGVKP